MIELLIVVGCVSGSLAIAMVRLTWMRRRIYSLVTPKPARKNNVLWFSMIFGLATGLLLGNILVNLSAGIACGTAAYLVRNSMQSRDRRRYHADLQTALVQATHVLQSGAGLLQALEVATSKGGRSAADLGRLAASFNGRSGIRRALWDWKVSSSSQPVAAMCSSLLVVLEGGGSTARAIEAGSNGLRQALTTHDQMRTQATQAQMSAAVLTVLPGLVLLMTLLGGGRAQSFLLHTAIGSSCLLAGVVLNSMAALTIAAMTARIRA